MYNDTLVLIPSLDPNEKLLELIQKLQANKFTDILIVNDGSAEKYDHIFQQIKNCTILKHAVNLGKGRALKTAFNTILTDYPHINTIVTVDSDGQHSIEDTIAVIEKSKQYPDSLILGCRNFDNPVVPMKSKFGNKLTRSIMSGICGVHVSDTQTGLRACTRNMLPLMMEITGERFEYETNVLLATNTFDIPIKEVVIQTIYYNDNASTHFHPIRDSIRIYSSLIKFVLSAISSFIIDIGLFNILIPIFQTLTNNYILFASIGARIISSLYNFFINKYVVFKKKSNKKQQSFLKYYLLVIIMMFVSSISIQILYNSTQANPTFLKILIDFILFCTNFIIQRIWVFK